MLSDRVKARNSRRQMEAAAAGDDAPSAVSVPTAEKPTKLRTTESTTRDLNAVQESLLQKAESYDHGEKAINENNEACDTHEDSSSGFTLVAAVNVAVGERDAESDSEDEDDSPTLTAIVVDEEKERDRYFQESISQGQVVTASVIDVTNRRIFLGLLIVVAISSLIAGVSLAGSNNDSERSNTRIVEKTAWVDFANDVTLSNQTLVYPPETDTPEQKALQWLVEEEQLSVPISDAKQWFALSVLSFSLNAPTLISDPTISSCEHLAITCETKSNEIISIDLHRVNLTGSIPNDVALLTKLTSLDLGFNELIGTVPWDLLMTQTTGLVFIDVDANQLTGTLPSPVNGTWPQMEKFWVMKNTFTGTISSGFSYLSNLQHFYARRNELEGTLPTEFGMHWDDLTWFNVEQNQLTGTIPSEYGQWSNLIYFEVDRNKLQSTLPKEIVQWTHLKEFWIQSNNFEGTLPVGVGNWTKLEKFYAQANDLSGTIPESIGSWTGLKDFRIDANNFRGTLPTEIGLWTGLGLAYVNNNEFTGTIPVQIANWTELDEAHFHSNDLVGMMPFCQEDIHLNALFADCCLVECTCCSTCLYGIEGANENCTILEHDLPNRRSLVQI